MLLSELLLNVNVSKIINRREGEVKGICSDSRNVCEGDLFVCCATQSDDCERYAREAVKNGAVCVAACKKTDVKVTQIIVENPREAVCEFAYSFYGRASDKLKLIGICGTNGKTTTSYMLKSIFENSGKSVGVIGTLGIVYADKSIEPMLTTPDPIYLHKTLSDMLKNGIEYVIIEVSAHAIYFEKLHKILFECCIFTNCTRDHLDFFGSMENYSAVKKSFFTEKYCKRAVINCDDETGEQITENCVICFTYAINNPSDCFAVDIKERVDGVCFLANVNDSIGEIKLNLLGIHNVYNALGAAMCASLLGICIDSITNGLNSLKTVCGRLERVASSCKISVFIDYAHTPDGLEKSLLTLKKVCKGKLICVYGCGGNRDVGKRKIMGEVVSKIADYSVITSDNPRFEPPLDIMLQIESGARRVGENYELVEDRSEAIGRAICLAAPEDAVLIAGKGCENYQEVMGVKRVYNDYDEAVKYINKYWSE